MCNLKMPPNLYNRKPELKDNPLPDFYVNIVGSSSGQFNMRLFIATYPDAKDYIRYLRCLRGKAISELLSNHRRNVYDMYEMIDSGKVDDFGCLLPYAMKNLRPKKN